VKEYADEGLSGTLSREKRPALNSLIKDAYRKKFDAVVCWDISRLGRSMKELMLFVLWTNALFKSALALTGPSFVATLIFYSCTRKGVNECFHKIQIINEYKSGTRCFYLLLFPLTII
jgi:hypothetical protein